MVGQAVLQVDPRQRRGQLPQIGDQNKRNVFGFQTSGVSWDPDVVTVTKPTGNKALFKANTITIESAAPYQHEISVSLRDHSLPTDALEANAGQVSLTRSIQMHVQVRHRLIRDGETQKQWRTVEIGILTSQALWHKELPGRSVFGPRYVSTNAKYRDSSSLRPEAPRIGGRAAMLSGFHDGVLTDRIDATSSQLILLGGTPGLLESDGETRLFGLPWVISFDSPAGLPAPLNELMQFSQAARTWKAAQFDTDAFSLLSRAVPPSVSMPSNLLSSDDIQQFLAAQSGQSGSADIMARMTEQTFVEPVSWDGNIPTADWPFFLKALIGLKTALENTPKPWQVTSLCTPEPFDVLPVTLPGEDTASNIPTRVTRSEVQLVTFSADGQISWFPLDLPAGFSGLKALSEQLGPICQAELAVARDASLRLAGFAEVGSGFNAQADANLLGVRPIRLGPVNPYV